MAPGASAEPGRPAARRPADAERQSLSERQLVALLELARALVSERDLEAVLQRVLEAARDLTGARYVALGVLDEAKRELEHFLAFGIDEERREEIGALPRGHGVLGELIRDPRPLRLADVGAHPRSYGFPPGHPSMTTFLGVPILIRGQAWGNLYLTEKRRGAEFDQADEDLVVLLSQWAAVGIENARLNRDLERHRGELQRAVSTLEANVDISHAVARGADADRVLELITKRGRALVGARTVGVLLPEGGEELVVAAAAGDAAHELQGLRLSAREPLLARLAGSSGARAITELAGPQRALGGVAVIESSALLAPLAIGPGRGVLAAFDRVEGGGFQTEHELLFASFAGTAASAIATTHAAERRELHLSMQASENERRRWARELHDETLQELGALKLILDASARSTDPQKLSESVGRGIERLEQATENLRALIAELRPPALDELGLGPGLEVLARRLSSVSGAEIELQLDLASGGEQAERLAPALEDTAYRLVQEAINNALKHARPSRVEVRVRREGPTLAIAVSDDGEGFDPAEADTGFGLVGMRERVALARGTLEIDSEPGLGTRVHARLPAEAPSSDSPERARR